MNLKTITDQVLLNKIKNLVASERELLIHILYHLREIEVRRLYSHLGHPSLLDYCVKVLKYSEAQALRRISAARLLRELPELDQKISSGVLTLTNVSQAQSFFRAEVKNSNKSFNIDAKKNVLRRLENCSSREGQKILLSLSVNPFEATKRSLEKKKLVTSELTEIRFGADDKLLQKMSKVKNLLSNKYSSLLTSELMEVLCDLAIERLDPVKIKCRVANDINQVALTMDRVEQDDEYLVEEKNRYEKVKCRGSLTELRAMHTNGHIKSTSRLIAETNDCVHQNDEGFAQGADRDKNDHGGGSCVKGLFTQAKVDSPIAPTAVVRYGPRKYISVHKKRDIWRRAQGSCQNCGSQYGLEIDHEKPLASGGGNELENLRLLCKSCNQRAAIESLGLNRVRKYIES